VPVAAEDADLGLVGLLQHRDDIGILLRGLDIGHPRQRPEDLGDALLVREAQRLVAEEDHEIFGERAANRRRGLVRHRRGEIDTGDLGADEAGDRGDGNFGFRVHFLRPVYQT
jgi:hypothetical protein